MSYVHAQIVKVMEDRDGLTKAEILYRQDGLYEYRVFRWVDADEECRDPAYWSPVHNSGLYDSAEQVECDASVAVSSLEDRERG